MLPVTMFQKMLTCYFTAYETTLAEGLHYEKKTFHATFATVIIIKL